MISLRYHAVSIAAVFLALAMGVVLGASGVSDRVLSAVSSQRDDLGVQVTRLSAERDALAARDGRPTSSPPGWGPPRSAGCWPDRRSRWWSRARTRRIGTTPPA